VLTPEQLKYVRARLEQLREALRDTAAQAQRQIAAPDAIADAISDRADDGNMLFAHEEAMNQLAQVKQTAWWNTVNWEAVAKRFGR